MNQILEVLMTAGTATEVAVEAVLVRFIVTGIRKAFPKIDARWVHLLVLGLSVAATAAVTDFGTFEAKAFLTQVVATSTAAIGMNEAMKRRR